MWALCNINYITLHYLATGQLHGTFHVVWCIYGWMVHSTSIIKDKAMSWLIKLIIVSIADDLSPIELGGVPTQLHEEMIQHSVKSWVELLNIQGINATSYFLNSSFSPSSIVYSTKSRSVLKSPPPRLVPHSDDLHQYSRHHDYRSIQRQKVALLDALPFLGYDLQLTGLHGNHRLW